jgi:hypothetical protein
MNKRDQQTQVVLHFITSDQARAVDVHKLIHLMEIAFNETYPQHRLHVTELSGYEEIGDIL